MPDPLARIDAVFLDVGNTLVSHDFDGMARLFAEHGLDGSADELRRAEAAARPPLSSWLSAGRSTEGLTTLDAYLDLVLERLEETRPGCRPAKDVEKELSRRLRASGLLFSVALPGARAGLDELRAAGLELVAVSNSDGHVEELLEAQGLRPALTGVVDSALVGLEKPDPAIFQHALERFGWKAARTLHVGDLYHVDVRGARAAGLEAALVDPYGDWSGLDCLVVRDVGELAQRLAAARAAS